jgi:hypothetical protein
MNPISPSSATALPPQQPATPAAHDWRSEYGPIRLRMPNDGERALLTGPFPRQREDSEDALFADGSAEAPGFSNQSGSGVELGHSIYEPENLRAFAAGVKLRPPIAAGLGLNGFDWEHLIRGFRDAGALAEQTGARGDINAFLEIAYAALAVYDAPTISFGQGYVPFTLAQHRAMVLEHPHHGYPANIRAVAWIEYLLAWSLKWSSAAHQHCLTFLSTCELAATTGSAQMGYGGIQGVPAQDVQQTFWWGLFAHAALACAAQTRQPAPGWVLAGMYEHEALPPYDNHGAPAPPRYTRTVNGVLVPADDAPGQTGDPGFGYWSSNCSVLSKMTRARSWLQVAAVWGPLHVTDEQSRRDSMLYRGAMS